MANVLVIEDDELIRKLCRDILEQSGHQVVEASDGEEGVRLLGQGSVDLIITDIFLPKKDGVEIIREIRREFPNLKIIAITGARGRFNRLPAAQNLGAHRILVKPFSVQEILGSVSELLKE